MGNTMVQILAEINFNYHQSLKVQAQPGQIFNYYYDESAFEIYEFS